LVSIETFQTYQCRVLYIIQYIVIYTLLIVGFIKIFVYILWIKLYLLRLSTKPYYSCCSCKMNVEIKINIKISIFTIGMILFRNVISYSLQLFIILCLFKQIQRYGCLDNVSANEYFKFLNWRYAFEGVCTKLKTSLICSIYIQQ